MFRPESQDVFLDADEVVDGLRRYSRIWMSDANPQRNGQRSRLHVLKRGDHTKKQQRAIHRMGHGWGFGFPERKSPFLPPVTTQQLPYSLGSCEHDNEALPASKKPH